MTHSQDEQLKKLYIDMFDILFSYARSVLDSESLAREAVQETFCIACSKIETVLSSPNPEGWLVNTLKNVIRNMRRSRAKLNQLIASTIYSAESKDAATRDEENVDVLYGDLTQNADYILLKKIAIEQYSIIELADELGINIEACKKRVQRARGRLKRGFSKYKE